MRQNKLIVERILEFLFGRKCWANIIATRGVADRYEMSSFIFFDKAEALEHRRKLETNMTYMWIETVSFRSRELRGIGN